MPPPPPPTGLTADQLFEHLTKDDDADITDAITYRLTEDADNEVIDPIIAQRLKQLITDGRLSAFTDLVRFKTDARMTSIMDPAFQS